MSISGDNLRMKPSQIDETRNEVTACRPNGPAQSAPILPVYVTPRQVADMLQVDERTVLRWAAQDASMPVSRFGGRVIRFERTALVRWLERKQSRRLASTSSNLAQARL